MPNDASKGNKNDLDKIRTNILKSFGNLSAQQIAVIIALLTDSLEVESILINRNQTVQIVLKGPLSKHIPLDKIIQDFRNN